MMLKNFISCCVLGLGICTVCSCKEKAKESTAKTTKHNDSARQETSAIINKMKLLHMALTNFRRDYAAFPCDKTANRLQDRAGIFGELQGNTANCYFRQLFARKNAVEEKDFYVNIGNEYREGDDKIANGACLEPGENMFAYVMRKPNTIGQQGTPAAMQPIINRDAPLLIYGIKHDGTTPIGGDNLEFEEDAIILYANGNIRTLHQGQDEQGTPIFPAKRNTGESSAADYVILPPAL